MEERKCHSCNACILWYDEDLYCAKFSKSVDIKDNACEYYVEPKLKRTQIECEKSIQLLQKKES